jgi:hypothetical protein
LPTHGDDGNQISVHIDHPSDNGGRFGQRCDCNRTLDALYNGQRQCKALTRNVENHDLFEIANLRIVARSAHVIIRLSQTLAPFCFSTESVTTG